MNATNWIAIAAIIAALTNPFITEWLVRRRAQELLDIAIPAANQPSALMKCLRKFLSGPQVAIVIAIVGVSNSLYALIKEANSSAPVSRQTVFTIGFHATTILLLSIGLWVTVIMLRVLSSTHKAADIADSIFDRMNALLQRIEENKKAMDGVTQLAKQLRADAKSKKGFID